MHVLALALWFGALTLSRLLGVETMGPGGRVVGAAVLVALVTGVAWAALQAALVHDDLRAAFSPGEVAAMLTATGFGKIMVLRLALMGVAALALLPFASAPGLLYLLAATALASLAFLGHAAAVPGGAGLAIRGVMGLHILAAGAWIGSLPILLWLGGRLEGEGLARVMQSFSRLGLLIVLALVSSGFVAAWHNLPGFEALYTSDYGRVLVLKVTLVGGMGVAALLNRNRFTPRLLQPELAGLARSGLRWSIAVEMSIGVGVVVLAAGLAGMDPLG